MLVVGLAALLFAWRWFDRRGGIALAPVGLVLGIGAVAIAMQMAVNYVGYGRPSLTEGAPAYTLSRLVETGLAKRYLDAHCGAETYVLCDYRDRPATYVGWYIFDPGSPFRAVWNRGVPHTDLVIGAHRSEAESLAIIGGTLREFPLATAWQMALATAQQLMSIHTAEAIGPTLGRDWIEDAVRIYYPDLYPSYARSLQNRDLLPLSTVRVLHVLVADASLFLLIFLAVRGALGRSWLGRFSLFLLLADLLKAVISGVLAGPANRYGSRLVWLVVLAAALAVYEHRQFLRGEFRRLLPRRADAA
jgi:hypothetical protein